MKTLLAQTRVDRASAELLKPEAKTQELNGNMNLELRYGQPKNDKTSYILFACATCMGKAKGSEDDLFRADVALTGHFQTVDDEEVSLEFVESELMTSSIDRLYPYVRRHLLNLLNGMGVSAFNLPLSVTQVDLAWFRMELDKGAEDNGS